MKGFSYLLLTTSPREEWKPGPILFKEAFDLAVRFRASHIVRPPLSVPILLVGRIVASDSNNKAMGGATQYPGCGDDSFDARRKELSQDFPRVDFSRGWIAVSSDALRTVLSRGEKEGKFWLAEVIHHELIHFCSQLGHDEDGGLCWRLDILFTKRLGRSFQVPEDCLIPFLLGKERELAYWSTRQRRAAR